MKYKYVPFDSRIIDKRDNVYKTILFAKATELYRCKVYTLIHLSTLKACESCKKEEGIYSKYYPCLFHGMEFVLK